MQSKYSVFYFIFLLKQITAVIYYVNETEYNRMPPIHMVDNYKECLQKPGDVYCTVDFNLVSDERSELLNFIQEYSEQQITHYNHSKITRGVCATQNCARYIQNSSTVSADSLEGCLNHSIWEGYGLKTKVEKHSCYSLSDNNINIDTSDIIVAIVLLIILMFNIIGSVKDIDCSGNNKKEKNLWTCFSITRNWKKLIANTNHPDVRLQSLKGIDGFRFFIMLGVMMVHCLWPFIAAAENSHDVELVYYDLFQYIFINGSMALQSYLVISGFLMSYKMEVYSEKKKIDWRMVPKGIMLRYFRLTPVYAVTIALLATWSKFLGPGAFWDITIKLARSNCRDRWWQNLLYINNYKYDSQCVIPAWYLGVDMQMFILGLITCVALRKKINRTAVLTVLFVIGIILPAVHTYIKDLHPHMMLMPQEATLLFPTDPTFNETYKMGHTNISSYIVGLALGYLVYRLQQTDIDIKKYQKFRVIYWSLLLLLLAVLLSGRVFYRDAPRDPMYVRVLYSALAKPIYGIIIAGLLIGMIFKLEYIYRPILEWKLWTIPSRLSYTIYIVHLPYLRVYMILRNTLLTFTVFNQVFMLFCLTVFSSLTAIPLWLFVEAPFIEVTKYYSSRKAEKTKEISDKGFQEKIDNTNL